MLVNQRRPGMPGPTAMYWVAWLVPPLLVFACTVSLCVWRLARPFAVALAVSFAGVGGILAMIWISIDVGGFAPT